jgi:hypothetical protein
MNRTIPDHDDPLDENLANDAAIARAAMSASRTPGERAMFLRTFHEPAAVEAYRQGAEDQAGAFVLFRAVLVRHYERAAAAAGLCDVDAESLIAALTLGLDRAERGGRAGRSTWDQDRVHGPNTNHPGGE